MKKVRNVYWHTVLIDTLKTETSKLCASNDITEQSKTCKFNKFFLYHLFIAGSKVVLVWESDIKTVKRNSPVEKKTCAAVRN